MARMPVPIEHEERSALLIEVTHSDIEDDPYSD